MTFDRDTPLRMVLRLPSRIPRRNVTMLAVFCVAAIAVTADLPGEAEFRQAAARLADLSESASEERSQAERAASRADKLNLVPRSESNPARRASLAVEVNERLAERATALERMATFAEQAELARAEMLKREKARAR